MWKEKGKSRRRDKQKEEGTKEKQGGQNELASLVRVRGLLQRKCTQQKPREPPSQTFSGTMLD